MTGRIRALFLAVALAVLLLAPGPARAAPQATTPAVYRERLQLAVNRIESARISRDRADVTAARNALGTTWVVQTTPQPTSTDLRPVVDMLDRADLNTTTGRNQLEAAAELLRQHIRSLDDATAAKLTPAAGYRPALDKALADAEAQRKGAEFVGNWLERLWRRLFGGRSSGSSPSAAPAGDVPWLKWVALAIGAVGVAILARGLLKSMAANGAGEETGLGRGRTARPDRPATPDELWQLAGEQAAAGDYKEGLRLAHLALLQHLDKAGLLRYMPSQTNREHEWLLRRRHPDLARTMHQLNDLVESRLYSGHGADEGDFRRGEALALQLWREGDAVSKSAQESSGASSSASSS